MNNNGLGFYSSPIDIRDFKMSAPLNITYPDTYIIPHLPKVKNQGSVNSCCAHVASTILEYHAPNIDLSTDFIYGAESPVMGENGPGMYPRNACEIMRLYGDALYNDCPTNTEVPGATQIAQRILNDSEVLNRAANFKINSYYRCTTPEDIKYALMTYGPVLGGIMWRDYTLSPDNIISFNGRSYGGHAITIIGWNENGWLIQNSWGEEFGDNGRFILPYSYSILEAWAIIDEPNDIDPALQQPTCFAAKSKILSKIINFFKNRRS